MKSLSSIYAFITLVAGGAFIGFVLGVVITILNSLVLFYGFRTDMGHVVGFLHLFLPTAYGLIYGYKAWVKRMQED